MSSLNVVKEQIRPLSGTQNMQLHSSRANTTEELKYLHLNTTKSEVKFRNGTKNYDDSVSLASSSNAIKCKNTDGNDMIQDFIATRSSVYHNETVTSEYKMKPAKYEHSSTLIDKVAHDEPYKSEEKNGDYENECKILSNTSFSKQILCNPQDHNLLTSKVSENKCMHLQENNEKDFSKQGPSLNSLKHSNSNRPNQVKTKLRSMWNNVKYGWRVKREVNLKVDSAVWLLGRCYHNKLSDCSTLTQDVLKQLKLDLLSKIWLTYRINFQTIPGTDFVSDSGWGCMLRCGQMMMAQALVCHFLSRDWRIISDQSECQYKMILQWFGDSLSNSSIFSLHHLVSYGLNYGRKAGDWYGPTHVAQVLRDALSYSHHPLLKGICMHVASDGIVFKQDIEDICCGSSNDQITVNPECSLNDLIKRQNLTSNVCVEGCDFEDTCPSYSAFGPPSFNTANGTWKSLILFVSVRLGNDKVNPFYVPCIKSLLAYEHCIGIIGGRPKHALYFIGWQEEKLIHLDPHACQPAVDVETDDFNEKSFHSSSLRTISFSEMDPSCAIGFYFKTEDQFRHFIEKFSEITAPMKRNLDYPIFALAEGRRSDIEEVDTCNAFARASFSSISNASNKDEDDDYILL